uniref:Centrosomal protein 126 n=1 Tax=Mastacembelus armatus TaxID=205130 RepID=A0A7N8YF24_9TELE
MGVAERSLLLVSGSFNLLMAVLKTYLEHQTQVSLSKTWFMFCSFAWLRALEERRKQWDVQEQRLRENILQQRRKHVQDATERFQRAHLPPSQRCRHSFRRNVPNIEHALSEIQGTLNSYTQQSSFLSSNSNISR